MERKRLIEHAVGGTNKNRLEKLNKLEQIYKWVDDIHEEHELEKSAELIQQIKTLDKGIEQIVKKYGGQHLVARLEKIHIIPKEYVSDYTDGEAAGGSTNSVSGETIVEENSSRERMLRIVAHELLHLNSFKSVTVKDYARLRRSGLTSYATDFDSDISDIQRYFKDFEEAVVEECSKEAFNLVANEMGFSEQISAADEMRSILTDYMLQIGTPKEIIEEQAREIVSVEHAVAYLKHAKAGVNGDTSLGASVLQQFEKARESGDLIEAARPLERNKLREVIQKTVEKSGGEFSEQQVFQLFAEAHFSGRYLPLARLIERIHGKGAFRELATSDVYTEQKETP